MQLTVEGDMNLMGDYTIPGQLYVRGDLKGYGSISQSGGLSAQNIRGRIEIIAPDAYIYIPGGVGPDVTISNAKQVVVAGRLEGKILNAGTVLIKGPESQSAVVEAQEIIRPEVTKAAPLQPASFS